MYFFLLLLSCRWLEWFVALVAKNKMNKQVERCFHTHFPFIYDFIYIFCRFHKHERDLDEMNLLKVTRLHLGFRYTLSRSRSKAFLFNSFFFSYQKEGSFKGRNELIFFLFYVLFFLVFFEAIELTIANGFSF